MSPVRCTIITCDDGGKNSQCSTNSLRKSICTTFLLEDGLMLPSHQFNLRGINSTSTTNSTDLGPFLTNQSLMFSHHTTDDDDIKEL